MMLTRLVAMLSIAGASVAFAAADGRPGRWAERAVARAVEGHAGLPPLPKVTIGRLTPAAVALGRKIFFDRRLSLNGTISCGMCHVPEQAFASNEMATAVGFEGRSAKRNAPTLLNVGRLDVLFHDGREHALETQFVAPLVAANEMANPSVGHVVAMLRTLPDYAGLFEQAVGGPAGLDSIGAALAAYQRTLVGGPSRFDRWHYRGESDALDDAERRGFLLFTGKAGCAQCHTIGIRHALFTDQRFHDTGYLWWRERQRQRPEASAPVEVAPGVHYQLGRDLISSVSGPPSSDLGRYEVTLDPRDLWMLRTPSLRNVALTGPYMHDGGLRTLAEVVAFYNEGGKRHDGQSPLVRPLGLDSEQCADLVAFLGALTSADLDELVDEARSAPPDNP